MDIVKTPKLIKSISIFCLATFIILFSGLRWRTGGDWSNYYFYFQSFNPSSTFSLVAFEPGYMALTYLVHDLLQANFTVFLLIFSLLITTIRIKFFADNADYILFAIFLFFCNVLAEVFPVRQSMAISICLSSLPYIKNRKPIPFILLTILGMQFHVSLILWFSAYNVFHLKWGVKWKIIFLVLSILMGLAGSLNLILEIFSNNPIFGRLAEKSMDYKNMGSDVTFGTNKTVALATGIARRIIILPLLLYFEHKYKNKDSLFSKYMNLFTFGNIVYFLVMNFLTMQRLATVFYMFEIIITCRIIKNIENKRTRFIWYIVFALYGFIKMIFIVSSARDYQIPYYWIFSDSTPRSGAGW